MQSHHIALCIQMYLCIDQYRTVSSVPMVQFVLHKYINVQQCHNSQKVLYIIHFSPIQLQCISFLSEFYCDARGVVSLIYTNFLTHSAPTVQVSNVKMERVNNNRAARVSWTPLTLHQARGFPVYFVTYQPFSQVGRVARAVNTVSTNQPSVVIDDLDPTTEYTIAVDVRTAGGKLQSSLAAGQSMLHQ